MDNPFAAKDSSEVGHPRDRDVAEAITGAKDEQMRTGIAGQSASRANALRAERSSAISWYAEPHLIWVTWRVRLSVKVRHAVVCTWSAARCRHCSWA